LNAADSMPVKCRNWEKHFENRW